MLSERCQRLLWQSRTGTSPQTLWCIHLLTCTLTSSSPNKFDHPKVPRSGPIPKSSTVRLHQTLGSSPSLHVRTAGSAKDICWAREQPGITSHARAPAAANKLAGNQWGLGQEGVCVTQKGSPKPRSHTSASTYRKGKDGKSWEAHGLPGPAKAKRPPAGMCHWPGKNNSFPKKQKPCHCEEQQETNTPQSKMPHKPTTRNFPAKP